MTAQIRVGHRSERGSTLVESALAFTVFFMFVFGIIDMSRMVGNYNQVAHAAREAVRYAIVRGASTNSPATQTTIANQAKTQLPGMDPASVTVTATWNPDNNPGGVVSVTVSYPYTFIAPYMPGSFTLRSRSSGYVMR